ncbi:retrovirus-related pol polyprotein from transposon RE1 [Citrus sinensis]|uniref:Retrovirus-related pol polyprotein from transposon RE1 n=1 Tax=Citrus sinensis TaxID=2711 RepID=A0ACB8KAM7_CITSI|nr:retrovirus-related pol polyprotein from transposon RE1 [Citrus sinensis]
MAFLSSNPNTTISVSSFTFTSPIKLDRSNYTIWKSQILSSVRANGLEDHLDSSKSCPDQFLQSESENSEILSLVVNSEISLELWTSLVQQFGSETFAKKVHLKMMLNNLRKGSMSMTEFFGKLKTITDDLAIAGSPVSPLDFITHLISGLGQPYYPVVVYIEANLAKMTVNEAYSMLLTHEARLEAHQPNTSKETKLTYAANAAQTGTNTKFGGQNNANWIKNGNNNNFGGFTNGKGASDPNGAAVICQICFKPKHTAVECRNRFNKEFVPYYNPYSGYNSYQNPGPRAFYPNSAPRAAFLATSESDMANQGWYVDSGATHHLTTNLQNLNLGREYSEVIQDSNNAQSSVIPSSPDAGPDSSHSHPPSAHSSPSHLSQNSSPHIQVHHPVQTSPVQNIHSMTTRSKAGVFKPKTYLTVAQELEPSYVKAALTNPKWQQAIISKYKARLVAKGFHQTQGVDFFETFSPVVKPCTIRIILSLVVMNHWTIRQLDVNNAFLNGILTEDVFMHQPEGFVHPQFPAHICKLTKALYGLKQALRTWMTGEIIVALIYVDDILITGSNSLLVENVIHQLGAKFASKDLREFNYFLGLKVTPTVDGLHLSQNKYIGDLLKKAQMVNCKGCPTLMSSTKKLVKDKGAVFENPSLYRSLVGLLQYVTLTRPKIAFTVNKLSQYLSNPSVLHWQACKRVLRKSVGGYCVYLGNNLVSWSSKKQHIVSRSTAESEYKALALTTAEVLWITYLFKELKVSLLHSPVLYYDNKSAEALASNPKYHSKTKHIELDLHFIREHVSRKELQISHVPSCDQVSDILTKPLAFDQFHYLRSNLNVLPRL